MYRRFELARATTGAPGARPGVRRRRAGLAVVGALVVLASLLISSGEPAQAFGSSQPLPLPSVSAGGYVTCGVQVDGTVACWGENGMPSNDVPNTSPGGAATPPPGAFLEVNAGYATVCGVRSDQTLACWGSGRFGKHLVPAGTFTHVAPGLNYVCALRTDGTLACWGGEDPALDPGQLVVSTMPSGAFTQVSMGNRHACALRADGSIACWGINADGQTNVPPGTYRSVNVSNFTSCALRTDGTPVCWGRNQGGQQTYPPGTFTQLTTGFAHVCGLRPDGTVTCWGRSSEGQTVVPPGTYTQVSAGTFHTCAVPVSGPPVRCWGNNMSGRVQPNLSTVAPGPGFVGYPYGFQFSMNPSTNSTLGGEARLSPAPTYAVTAGTLPPGVALSPSGVLSGTPTSAGSYSFTVAAGNGLSPPDCVNPSLGSQSLPCTPGDPTSVATATRVFTVSVSPDAPVLGGIGGLVTAAAGGTPVAGAALAVTYAGGAPAGQALTGADGSYLVGELPPGSYHVRASGTELQPQTKPAVVAEGQTTAVDFVLGPLVRPTVVGVSNNHYQTVTDGVFVQWSEPIQPFGFTASNYSVHAQAGCSDPAVATASEGFWQPSSPTTRDLAMNGWENVVPGGTYHLRVAAGTELGTVSQQRNAAACVPFVAELRPADRSAVAGRVTTAATGAPIAGATVTVTRMLREPGTVAGVASTDGAGNYRVDGLPPGPYEVTAAAAGHTPAAAAVSTQGGATATRHFALGSVPVAGADTFVHYGSDTALVVAAPGVLANDADADDSGLTASLVGGPSRGSVDLNGDGSFTYRPEEDFVGTDTFTYRVSDGVSDSAPATVTITVGAGCRGQAATVTGTGGNDRLIGTAGRDVIAGLGGDDTINAQGGDDVVCAGSGGDTVNAAAGNDTVDGGSGDDTLRGDAGDDALMGGGGADTLLGDAGDDVLSGGAGGPDRCQAGGGVDTLDADHGCEVASGVP